MKKEEFKLFRKDFAEAVKELESKYNLSIKMKSIRYDDTGFSTTLNCSFMGEQAEKSKKEKFEISAELLHIPKDWYHKEIEDNGDTYRIVGLNTNAPKNPIKIMNLRSGTEYRAPKAWVRTRL